MNKTLLRKIARFIERNPDQFNWLATGIQNTLGDTVYPIKKAPAIAKDGRLPRGYCADVKGLAVGLTPKEKRGNLNGYTATATNLGIDDDAQIASTAKEIREIIRNA